MGNENGEWIMRGLEPDDPLCIKSPEELTELIIKVGFLPLFRNSIPGFSVEEHTVAANWWSDNEAADPWEWRKVLARSEKVAYGKFFEGKAGYVSPEWLPRFINYRRDGYDFDARWDDEKAKYRSKCVMDLFEDREELSSNIMKELAGFGKDGMKNFEGTINELQMQTYLTVRDFRRRLNKRGEPYGWGIAVYSTPEKLWGSEYVSSMYGEDPKASFEAMVEKVRENFPAEEKVIRKILSIK